MPDSCQYWRGTAANEKLRIYCAMSKAGGAALQRIKSGSYGQCVVCGVDIATARVKAASQVGQCFDCQEKSELKFAQIT